jgi:hypothetical protein
VTDQATGLPLLERTYDVAYEPIGVQGECGGTAQTTIEVQP